MDAPVVVEGKVIEEEAKQLITLLHELEKGQIDILDQSGKRIIDLVTGLLGVLFAVTAFGHDFPPPYLKSNEKAQLLLISCLVFYLGAMFMGMRTLQPRKYKLYRNNLTEMRKEIERIIAYKSAAVRWAGVLFWLGTLLLCLLIGSIVLVS